MPAARPGGLLVAALLLSLFAPATRADPYAEAVAAFERLDRKIGPDGHSRSADGATLAWGESYLLMAYVAFYEATGRKTYLDRVGTHVDRLLANRDDRRKLRDDVRRRVMPSWSTARYSKGQRYAWLVHAGMITFPIARWVLLINRSPGLEPTYGQRAERYLAAIEQTVAAFDADWRDAGYYHGRYLGRPLPLNQQNAMGRTLVTLWQITGKDRYRQRALALAATFQRSLRSVGDRYTWPYWPGGKGAEDISHAAINVDFAYCCYRAGFGFDRAALQRFAATLEHCARKPGFAERVDGKGGLRYAAQAGRWAHLATVHPGVGQLLLAYFRKNWEANRATGLLAAAYLAEVNRPPARGRRR